MQKKDIFRLSLLVTVLALSQSVWALGLGKLTVQSALGQPLEARIELMGTSEEFSELTANIAAPSLYQEKDLVYQAALTRTRVTLERRADGSAFLKIVSSQPLSEPYVDLLVEVSWPAGHALREYTVLLDPPAIGKPEPMMLAQQATVGGRTTAARTPPAATTMAPVASSPKQRVRPRPTPSRVSGTGITTDVTIGIDGDTYTVQRGDTLSGIARTYKAEEITLNQALAALHGANPKAFIGNNMNRLRSGAVLQVPSQEEMAATDTREANKIVRVQVAEWRSYIEQVAGQPTPVRPGTGTTTAGGKITSTPTVVDGPGKGQDQLVVSAGKSQPDARGSAAAGSSSADAEERIALQKALEEEKSRVRDLEEVVKKLQRALEINNQKLAEMEQKALAATAAPQPVPAPVPAPQPEPTPQPAPVSQLSPSEPAPEGTTEEVAPPPEPAPPPPKPPRPAPPPPPPPEPSFLETVVETVMNNLIWVGVAFVVLAAGLGFMIFRRRRAEENAIDSLFGATTTGATVTGGTVSPHSSLTSTAGSESVNTRSSNAAASSNSILSEFSREGLGSIDTGEVDPLAEADVYLAYGRAQQAEEILQDALKRGPDRQDVFLKLLEVYADQKKASEFEATANQLHALTQGKGDYWQRAIALGQRLLPGNALFAGGKRMDAGEITGTGITSTHVATEPLQVGGQAVDPRGFAPIESKSIAERAADIATRAVEARGIPTRPPERDFTFSMENAPAQNDFGVDLDLEELSRFKNYGKAEERVDITTKPQAGIDFDLDDFATPPQIDEEKGLMRQAPSLAEIDFSSDNDSIAEDPSPSILGGQWHDAATKLDLARAYQATGDAEACREILQEVLQEGDDQQKAEAKAILKSLS
jgi:pilus assembly protein FimV